jgi:hypothetical protein
MTLYCPSEVALSLALLSGGYAAIFFVLSRKTDAPSRR